MKEYPKIQTYHKYLDKDCIAFYKMDGSNLRVEYSFKTGWYKWGTRLRLFDESDPDYGCAIALFHKKYAADLEKLLSKHYPKCQSAIFYMEFFGPNSFAGQHLNKEEKDIVLFDINIYKKGFIDPETFLKVTESIHVPAVIYRGKLTEDFVKEVREKRFPVDEGVVCKGGSGHKLWMAKIKTWDYLARLKKVFGVGGYQKYWE